MSANSNLSRAKVSKEDEFYTQISDVERELKNYRHHLEGKHIFLNCDDPESSNFWKYFELNFDFLNIKKVTSTHYNELFETYRIDLYRGEDGNVFKEHSPLKGNGDFRSDESIEILKECDIVVTNPPFSLFREYITQLIDYDKKFLVIGNQNAITYSELFPLFKDNKLWLGTKSGDMSFMVPHYYEPRKTRFWIDESGQKWRSMGNICWYTNLEHSKRSEELIQFKTYSSDAYPEYDHYNAINVDKVRDIPFDYNGAMGVPITFLDKYNPSQFEILDANEYRKNDSVPLKKHGLIKDKDGSINGKPKYVRILIKRRV